MSRLSDDKTESRSGLVNTASTLVIIALFVIAALVLLYTGLQVYKNVVLASNENFELRTSLSYVAAKVRQFDAKDCVYVDEIDGVKVLVLAEEFDGEIYNTMIYHRDGALCELMQPEGSEPDFEFGFEALEIDGFSFEETEKGTLRLTAENAEGETETLTLVLRSEER